VDLTHLSGSWLYWGVLIAAMVEGEIAYLGAAALVAAGQLNLWAVVGAGTVGAALGDQFFFYALRGRLPRRVRRLEPIPERYRGRFTNVQAAIGLAGLRHLPEFIERTRRHARILDDILGDVEGITIPRRLEGRTHVFYQYCAYVPDSETIVKRCIRRGVDVAPMHVDVCTRMPLFDWRGPAAPGAELASTAVQLPVYESLTDANVERVGLLVRAQVERLVRAVKPRGERVTLPPAPTAAPPSGAAVPAAGASASASGR
jgi:hypothetical protein